MAAVAAVAVSGRGCNLWWWGGDGVASHNGYVGGAGHANGVACWWALAVVVPLDSRGAGRGGMSGGGDGAAGQLYKNQANQ